MDVWMNYIALVALNLDCGAYCSPALVFMIEKCKYMYVDRV